MVWRVGVFLDLGVYDLWVKTDKGLCLEEILGL